MITLKESVYELMYEKYKINTQGGLIQTPRLPPFQSHSPTVWQKLAELQANVDVEKGVLHFHISASP
jgi:hypothetical protein